MSTPSNTNNNDNGKTPTPTAPPSSPMYGDYFPTDDSSFRDQDVGDEALARRLQEEENRLMSFRGSKDQVVPHAEPVRTNTMNIDERYSRKLAQELGDQEIAYGLQQREQQRLDRSQSRQNQLLQEVNARKKWTKRRLFNIVLLIAIVASAVVVFAFFGSSLWKRGELDSNLPPYFSNDWGGAHSTTDFSRWRSEGKGLGLTVQNALSSDWDTYFERAILDWNSGSPDALDLSVTKADAPDPQCSPIRGIMKVCNNYYGGTGWTGLNEVYYDEKGYITYSVAKMNENYLNNAKTDERQYVMCHELGHGFGLPHRDETINNEDLGTCLDYTNRPEANQHPDSVDFENLASLYGTVPPGARKLLLRTRTTTNHNNIKNNNINGATKESSNHFIHQQAPLIPHSNNSFQDGRILHQTKHGAMYERDADNGGKIVSYVVFSKNN